MRKTSKLKVSVITVVYNGESQLGITAESVFSQSLGDDFEWIVVDGESTDGSVAIARSHMRPQDTLISEKDRGIYDAMNKGLNLASGDWLIYMNAGDTFFDKETLAVVSTRLFSNIDVYLGESLVKLRDDISDRIFHVTPKRRNDWWKGLPACHQSIIYRRETLSRFVFDIRYTWCGDFDQFSRLANSEATIESLPMIISIFDGNSPIKRSPWRYIFERFHASRRFNAGLKRHLFYAKECIQVALLQPAIALIRLFIPKEKLLSLRRIRGTSGDQTSARHNSSAL